MEAVKIWPKDGMVKMNAVGRTHAGRVREKNEDSLRLDPERGLVVVADGLGGHPHGEIASELAAHSVERFFQNSVSENHHFPDLLLPEAIFFAHAALKEAACESPYLHGMGTTLVIGWIPPGSRQLRLAHIGDSRAYLLRGGRLEQLTEDHTLWMETMKAGKNLGWTEPDLSAAHILVQAVGIGEMLRPSNLELTLEHGDRLLFCTDGLTNELTSADIRAILSRPTSPDETCQNLIQAALQAGGNDNVTVAVWTEDE